jgi:hypothetical protein
MQKLTFCVSCSCTHATSCPLPMPHIATLHLPCPLHVPLHCALVTIHIASPCITLPSPHHHMHHVAMHHFTVPVAATCTAHLAVLISATYATHLTITTTMTIATTPQIHNHYYNATTMTLLLPPQHDAMTW